MKNIDLNFPIYYESDVNVSLLKDKKIAVIGYGSQGHAHALNLRDSGMNVRVGLRQSSASCVVARDEGLQVMEVAEAAKWADVVMLLAPDQNHREIFEQSIKPNLEPGNVLCFGHGFSIHFSQIVPPPKIDVVMIAPKGPGHLVRRMYTAGSGVPCLVAVHQNDSGKALDYALAWAAAIGGAKSGVIPTTFKDETETDLFGEQVVLCGGLTELIRAGFETLVEAGYPAHIAYFECLHELKLIIDLIYEGGISKMNHSISDTAKYGEYISGPRIVNDQVRQEMKKVLKDIQEGRFAQRWMTDNSVGLPEFKALHRQSEEHPIEIVGKKLRSMFSWLK